MEWVRGRTIGQGSFGAVSLAIPKDGDAQLMAVKSSDAANSAVLRNEKSVLDQVGECPQIVRCLGDGCSIEDGREVYNVFLEYAVDGSLAEYVERCGGGLPETEVRRYAGAMLRGLSHIHARGFVHCDVKLQNVLRFSSDSVKIADFGLARRVGERVGETAEIRGTPLYMSPESVSDGEYDCPVDIWALGCAVVEMAAGRPAWKCRPRDNFLALLMRIGAGDESPEIPEDLSEEGRDFVRKCFVKDPRERWTAEELLCHPFVAAPSKDFPFSPSFSSTSPTAIFDFPEWTTSTVSHYQSPGFGSSGQDMFSRPESHASPTDRLRQLVTDEFPDWTDSGSWVTVR